MVRFKNRYFLCEIVEGSQSLSLQALTSQILQRELKEQISLNFGDMGLAQVSFSFQVKYLNKMSRIFILRVSRDYKNLVWTTLMMMSSLNGQNVAIRVLHCSGTVKRIEVRTRRLLQRWVHRILHNPNINQKIREILENDYEQTINQIQQIEH